MAAAMPVMALAALAIKLDDHGPVMFRQVRVGHRGEPFRILKFRTMTVDAETERTPNAPPWTTPASSTSRRATAGSPVSADSCGRRVSTSYRHCSMFSRRDEHRGTASTGARRRRVGRGLRRSRGLVKPGITGLWQISGRSDASEEERIRFDHSYVDNWSYVQDLMIIWRTVRAVLKRDGAY